MRDAKRYYLSQDGSCHWYVIPVENRAEWDAWLALDEDDERSWDAPTFAWRTYGSYELVTFERPAIGGETRGPK